MRILIFLAGLFIGISISLGHVLPSFMTKHILIDRNMSLCKFSQTEGYTIRECYETIKY